MATCTGVTASDPGVASIRLWWCAKPSPPWGLWAAPCLQDSAQRQPEGGIAVSPDGTMRNQQAEHISVPSWVSAQGPVGGLSPAQDLPAGSLVHARQPPDSQLPPAPALPTAHCSLVGAASHPCSPCPLWSHTRVHHPILLHGCSGGCRPETGSGRALSYLAPVTVSGTVSTGKSPSVGCAGGRRRSGRGELCITANLHSSCLLHTRSYPRTTMACSPTCPCAVPKAPTFPPLPPMHHDTPGVLYFTSLLHLIGTPSWG